MGKFTYKQFEKECKRWGITVEDGYRAMCFTASILGENIDNCLRYQQRIDKDPYNSSAVKNIAFNKLENAQKLMELFLRFDEEVYDVLEAWADANEAKAVEYNKEADSGICELCRNPTGKAHLKVCDDCAAEYKF